MSDDEKIEHLLLACEGLADALLMMDPEVLGPVGKARVRASLAHLEKFRAGLADANQEN